MPKSKSGPKRKSKAGPEGLAPAEDFAPTGEEQIYASNLSLHDLFQQQAAKMLDRADLTEEQKQTILIGMSCPCCGAGGMSFTAKLKG
jgi:hypothetical protein